MLKSLIFSNKSATIKINSYRQKKTHTISQVLYTCIFTKLLNQFLLWYIIFSLVTCCEIYRSVLGHKNLSVLHKCAHRKDRCIWLIYQYFSASVQIFPSLNFKHQKIVSLSKIRMFPTSVFLQYVKLILHWTNQDSASSCFFKQLNIATSRFHKRPQQPLEA